MRDSSRRIINLFPCCASISLVWVCAFFLAIASGASVGAQGFAGFVARYQARVTATQAEQPHWATPLFTSTPRLEQGIRADFGRQTTSQLDSTWNLGGSRGLQLVPTRHMEFRVNVSPYLLHEKRGENEGFGDVSFNGKYRLYARNEEHGNAIVSVLLAASIPTSGSGNGSCCALVTPTLVAGKGYGLWAFTTSAGVSLPVTNAKALGRTVTWSNIVQTRLAKTGVRRFLSPELELNSTFYEGGSSDGKVTTYATPGMVLGRFPLTHDASGKPGRLGMTFGAAEQIAVTSFHKTNHNLLITSRLRF